MSDDEKINGHPAVTYGWGRYIHMDWNNLHFTHKEIWFLQLIFLERTLEEKKCIYQYSVNHFAYFNFKNIKTHLFEKSRCVLQYLHGKRLKTEKSVTSPLAPIAFPSSLYSTNHHGLVVVASSVVVVVAGVVVVVLVVVGVVVVVGIVVNWS